MGRWGEDRWPPAVFPLCQCGAVVRLAAQAESIQDDQRWVLASCAVSRSFSFVNVGLLSATTLYHNCVEMSIVSFGIDD